MDTEVLADNDRRAEDVNKEEAVEARLEVEAEQGAEGFERSERDSDAQFLSLGGSSLLPGGVVASPNIGLVGAGHARHVNLGNGGVGLGGARLGGVGVASAGLGGVGLGVGHRQPLVSVLLLLAPAPLCCSNFALYQSLSPISL